MFHRLRWMLCLGLLFSSLAMAAPLSEQQKIDALIHSVETVPGAQFIRNGSSYDAKAAVEHLQMKRRYAGNHIKTASDFIELCASRSSMTGLPYKIRFADGKTQDAAEYFHARLKQIEAQPVVTSPATAAAPG
jgi:hypothetical protein